jgi:cystathionine beta-synthase
MADYGFLQTARTTIGDLLATRDPSLPMLVHTHPEESVRQAIAILREYSVSQMPVIKQEPPVVLAEVVGAVTERDLMDRAFTDPDVLDRPVGDVMGDPLPTVGAGEPLEVAVNRLEGAPAVLVLDSGHPVAVITRVDVLASLASMSR